MSANRDDGLDKKVEDDYTLSIELGYKISSAAYSGLVALPGALTDDTLTKRLSASVVYRLEVIIIIWIFRLHPPFTYIYIQPYR